ncbi:MAG: DNA-3-methyladenine glycosylase I [Parcubacteria group bacterium]|nr:DNA-3-methyladenine glycosylase I [Parcubacteria group bacterium]
MKRCGWADQTDLMRKYHDLEWGKPLHNDKKLFEFLMLEGSQAGLSWETVLKKRQNYRKAFDNFDPLKIAKYNSAKQKQLLNNPGIIRNRLKVKAFITNAQKFLEVKKEFGSFDKYIWSFVDGNPIKNKFKNWKAIPATTEISDALSKDLKNRGFTFVGTTICYAFMQAVGMVNDHTVDCFRYQK